MAISGVSAEQLIRKLNLQPHPEGGFFRETYRCGESISKDCLDGRYSGARSISTSIYYLLTVEAISVMHKVQSDEIYHFYLGAPLEMLLVYPGGKSEIVHIGPDINAGQHVQYTIPRGVWQGSRVLGGQEFALVGATVAPGFDFADFEEGSFEQLSALCRGHQDLLKALTR